ncbi:trissin receptor-like [Lineus longissimus]|uniref:trissin receptor-like n=1 Tax=Lineus longissimus TaxID=88925 RepID=UPI00315C7F81
MNGLDNSTLDITDSEYVSENATSTVRPCWVLNETLTSANCTDVESDSDSSFDGEDWKNPFHIPHIRALFITAYSIVFGVCLLGNAAVIYVILRSRRMRSITNFFLANLAFADFCVGIFCVLPTLTIYLDTVWTLGRVMCKLNYFVQQMAFVASVTILTVIAIERYVAIVYPMKSKQLTTRRRLIFFIVLIWSIAIFYNVIQLFAFDTTATEFDGVRFEFCVMIMKIDRQTYYTINFIMWYFVPLLLMTFIYTKIGVVLWKSTMLTTSVGKASLKEIQGGPSIVRTRFSGRKNRTSSNVPGDGLQMSNYINPDDPTFASTAAPSNQMMIKNGSPRSNLLEIPLNSKEHGSQTRGAGHNLQPLQGVTSVDSGNRPEDELTTDTSSTDPVCLGGRKRGRNNYRRRIQDIAQKSKVGGADNVLKSRRKVVRLLVLIVGSFAACTLPFQVRVLIVAWGGNVPSILVPITMLLMFFNSGLNPILYAFFSENFRRAMKEVFVCRLVSHRQSVRRDALTSRTSAVSHTNV